MESLPERKLIGAIIEHAISDAKTKESEGLRAAEFLIGPRSDPYFALLDIDASEYRKGLVAYANQHTSLAQEAKARRILRNNIEQVIKIYGYQL